MSILPSFLKIMEIFFSRLSTFLYWLFLHESVSKSRPVKLLFAVLIGSMITFWLQPDYLEWNLVTFSIDHLQFHTLWQLFNNSIYANNNCYQIWQFLYLKTISKRGATDSFQGFTINFSMTRNCYAAIATSEYYLGNSMVVIWVTTTLF